MNKFDRKPPVVSPFVASPPRPCVEVIDGERWELDREGSWRREGDDGREIVASIKLAAYLAAVARLTAEVERLDAVELRYRKELWLNHGHDHLYGDDGEMQCVQCPGEAWDYRRAPLEVIERAVWEVRQARFNASLTTPPDGEATV